MNTMRTLLCIALLLSAGRLVPADATVIEDFLVSWARADGDTLLIGGTMKDGKHGALCMADADGTVTRLCEGRLSSSYDDAVIDDAVIDRAVIDNAVPDDAVPDGATVFAVGMDLADFRVEAWHNKERLYTKTLDFDGRSVGEARIFAMPDHILLICRLGEQPKLFIKPCLLVAQLSKKDGSIAHSETVSEYDNLLWAGRDESGNVCFMAANTDGSSETMYVAKLALYRVGEKAVREKQFTYHQEVAEGEDLASLWRMERIQNRFVALAWTRWDYKGVNYLLTADPGSETVEAKTFETDPEAWPERWFLGEDCFYIWSKTSGETDNQQIEQVSLDGELTATYDPDVAVRKALVADGWVADEAGLKLTKPGTDLACYVYPDSIEVVQFGDALLLLYSFRQDDNAARTTSFRTLVLKQWK
jgi:hypothetical protein